TVCMGVLGTFMPPAAAATLLLIPSFVTNVWQLLSGQSLAALTARLWPMMLGIMVGTVAGSWLLTSGSTRWTTAGLGLALTVYAASSLFPWVRPPSIPASIERRLSLVIGFTTGLVTGGTGVFVIPAVPYL